MINRDCQLKLFQVSVLYVLFSSSSTNNDCARSTFAGFRSHFSASNSAKRSICVCVSSTALTNKPITRAVIVVGHRKGDKVSCVVVLYECFVTLGGRGSVMGIGGLRMVKF